MNNNIYLQKFNALKDIFNAYQNYDCESKLEEEINKLKDKISNTEFKSLTKAYDKYLDYILGIFSKTRRVFIKLEKKELKQKESELEVDMFAPFEDLE